jgi:hypothetical protein
MSSVPGNREVGNRGARFALASPLCHTHLASLFCLGQLVLPCNQARPYDDVVQQINSVTHRQTADTGTTLGQLDHFRRDTRPPTAYRIPKFAAAKLDDRLGARSANWIRITATPQQRKKSSFAFHVVPNWCCLFGCFRIRDVAQQVDRGHALRWIRAPERPGQILNVGRQERAACCMAFRVRTVGERPELHINPEVQLATSLLAQKTFGTMHVLRRLRCA